MVVLDRPHEDRLSLLVFLLLDYKFCLVFQKLKHRTALTFPLEEFHCSTIIEIRITPVNLKGLLHNLMDKTDIKILHHCVLLLVEEVINVGGSQVHTVQEELYPILLFGFDAAYAVVFIDRE